MSIDQVNYNIFTATQIPCKATDVCLNWRKCELLANRKESVATDIGFDLTIQFVGLQTLQCESTKPTKIYVAHRYVDGDGGSQLRIIRDDIYKLIVAQLRTLIVRDARTETGKQYKQNIVFANILEGSTCQKHMAKFKALLAHPEYKTVADRVYIGNLDGYVVFLNCQKQK